MLLGDISKGGFKATEETSSDGNPICGSTDGIYKGIKIPDYIPHHQAFQYYETTATPNHLRPTTVNMIGHTDQANHQYGLSDFWNAADSGHLPSVGFLKAPVYQDGHEGYSNPLDEQTIIVNTIITYNNYLNGIALPKLLPKIILQY